MKNKTKSIIITIIKERYKQPIIIKSSVTTVGGGSANICIEKCELFQ